MFAEISPTDQLLLHDYFKPDKGWSDLELLQHKEKVTKEHPSLPHQAGRALSRFWDVTTQLAMRRVAKAKAPVAPAKRLPQSQRRITVKPLVKPEIDVKKLARAYVWLLQEQLREQRLDWTKAAYDADGRPVGQCRPNSFSTSATDGAACNPGATATGKFGTKMDYDEAGRVTTAVTYRETSATDNTVLTLPTSYGYDADGNAVSVTDPRSITTTVGYDLLDRKVSSSTPRGGATPPDTTIRYWYDPVGNQTLTAVVCRHGNQCCWRYHGNRQRFRCREPSDRHCVRLHRRGQLRQHRDGNCHHRPGRYCQPGARRGLRDRGGSNTHSRTSYDQDGNVTTSYQPRAFHTSSAC